MSRKKSRIVFPWSIVLKGDGILSLLPTALVTFARKDGEQFSFIMLVDSGASISALPKSDASLLSLCAEDGTPVFIAGVGGTLLRGWRHVLSAHLMGLSIRFPLVFLDREDAPKILGREGVFSRFGVVFDEPKRRTAFLDTRKDRKALNSVFE